ncbi:MAG: DUF5606 domain-containing protein [Bacteroidales bacterium]|jgi:hypothetical protein|nr:DUF5606 domain-containing protein [Bacteroidales bacterium]MBQ1905018.1 DUF5606 domain-containing protein [Bacteroidales bacterium]MBQ2103780.1 DUF5606 domain-containing protein [Bacteroidales bacterium]MBQ2502249.1 DUF5606 domain-containing protein [Bacteroidales bacterium]MBQ3975878.1 DUF5606 domain-containing protein [Bacteroidales bacterium]
MKTDLSKILSVSGKSGLFQYLAQARNGVIAEALSDKKRIMLDIKSRITTLADISIFADSGELKLKEVFLSLGKIYKDQPGPDKLPENELKALFAKAVPDYDQNRFYPSHMKKVLDWYNQLARYASLDFVEEETQQPADE